MKMKRIRLLLLCLCAVEAVSVGAVSLDSCRMMALANNKQLKIADVKVARARYQHKSARAAYLPAIDAEASYVYNQKELALIGEDAKLPTMSFNPTTGGYDYNVVKKPDGEPLVANGVPVPSEVALLPKSALTYDIHNVFAGAVSITQPLYMGGKIHALNKIAGYAEQMAEYERKRIAGDVVYDVDVAYWLVVSLKAKERLAQSYVSLLDTLNYNVKAMLTQGVATQADVLSVRVKLNEARVDLVKTQNGVSLARMQLSQLCGLPVDTEMTLDDEIVDVMNADMPLISTEYDINEVYEHRNDVNELGLAVKVNEQRVVAERASMLPQIALVGAYSVTNPNSFNGFKNEFGGMFSVGAMVKIPLWHWGGNYNRYKVAKSDAVISRITLYDAKEQIALQVRQASYKMQEAMKVYHTTRVNCESAEENLRTAQLGFKEGVLAVDAVMCAQTAWLKANADAVDAIVDVRLAKAMMEKLGVY